MMLAQLAAIQYLVISNRVYEYSLYPQYGWNHMELHFAVHAEVEVPPDTPLAQLESILEALDGRKQAWAATPPSERALYLRQCVAYTLEVRTLC